MSCDDPSRRLQPGARPVVGSRRAPERAGRAGLLVLLLGVWSCTPEHPATPRPLALSVRAAADTGRMAHLEIRLPRPARAWLARVTPYPPGMLSPPLPDAGPDTVPPQPFTPAPLEVEAGLLPPVLRAAAPLVLPGEPAGGGRRRFEAVEFDVRVSETGEVTDVIAAGGDGDPALVEAASACVRRMRFYPARRAGVPISVWCRQRFEFGPGGAVRL